MVNSNFTGTSLISNNISTGMNMSTLSKFPGLKQEYIDEIEERTKDVPSLYKDSMQQQMYSDYYQKQQMEDQQSQRTAVKNQARQKVIDSSSPEEKKGLDSEIRKADFADLIRRKYNINTQAGSDDKIIETFVSQVPDGMKLYGEYVNNGNPELLYRGGLVAKTQEAKTQEVKETTGQKIADVGVGIAQSPGKRGYNMIGQWMDKLGEWGAEKIEGTDLEKWIQDKAVDLFGEEAVREYHKINEMEKAEGKQFNGRTQTDIRTPILGEERAESPYTKGGEIVGDIGSAIALTAPLSAATVPAMVNSTLGGAVLLGGAEGVLDTALAHYGMEGNLDVTPGELSMGALLGGVGGGVTNRLSGLKNVGDKVDEVGTVVKNATKTDDVVENASKVEKVVENPKTVAKIEEKTDKAKEYAGRIGQGDIDDQTQVIEGVKTMTRKNGKDKVKDIKKYSDLENMIKDTEKQIVKEENDLLIKYPEKITDWESEEVVKGLGSQEDVVTRDYIDEGIELLAKYNKNDPAELRRLEMIQEVKDTQGLTLLEAKNIARELTAKLSKKFYNSNDELRNSMSAETYEKIRKGIQNAVRNKLPDDTLKKLDFEYSNLKTFEGLADDMAEKVNALTQKIKKTGPLEKLGRQLGTAINWLSGNSVKGLVEKFLPSNMGNKINNSIDMERELSKNMKKLLKLNEAIDKLNNPTSKTSLKDAAKEFVSIVEDLKQYVSANGVNTTTRGLEAVSEEIFTEN